MIRKAAIVLFALTVLTITGVGVRTFGHTSERGAALTSTSNDYTVAFLPSRERAKLVDVYAVQSEIGKEPTVKKVAVANLSNKNVMAVKFGWRIHNSGAAVTLLEGQSRLLYVPLSTGKRLFVKYPLVGLSQISEPLEKRGLLTGDLRVEVSVDEILFDDGSQWSAGAQRISNQSSPAADLVKRVAFRSTARYIAQDETAPSTEEDTPIAVPLCNNSLCAFIPRLNKWICTPVTGYNCKVNADNTCTDSVCPVVVPVAL